LKDAYDESLLILEGDIDRFKYSLPNPNVILGGILTVVVDMGIKILYSRDMDETAKILHMIWKRVVKRGETTVIRYKPKIMSKKERLIFILEGFPGIGGRLAENILNHYRTIRNFANTSLSELSTIEGIGEKKAREIYELLNLDFKKIRE
jgi:ERCC4-type nuclease